MEVAVWDAELVPEPDMLLDVESVADDVIVSDAEPEADVNDEREDEADLTGDTVAEADALGIGDEDGDAELVPDLVPLPDTEQVADAVFVADVEPEADKVDERRGVAVVEGVTLVENDALGVGDTDGDVEMIPERDCVALEVDDELLETTDLDANCVDVELLV